MAIEVPPTRVPQGRPSPQATLAVALVALVSIVGFAILGKAADAPAPRSSQPAVLATPVATRVPTPLPTPAVAGVTPTRAPSCKPVRIVALSGPIARHPRPLTPTGFATVTPWMGAEGTLVADHKVGFWASGSGRLARLDGSGRMTASWTFADDAIFPAWGIVPARGGGVWLWSGPTIAWFDGQRFRDVVAAPGQPSGPAAVVDVGEAADGSLWVATWEGGVFHWDGRSWSDACGGRTFGEISHLAIDAAGGVWVSPSEVTGGAFHFDGMTWSIPPSDPAWVKDPARLKPWSWVSGLVAADDGSVWTAAGGIGRFDGASWTSVGSEALDLSGTVSIAVAPGGAVWAATGVVSLGGDAGGPHLGTHIAHFDGRSWSVYDATDGLPAPELANSATITAVAASRDAVVAATRDGFYRLVGDRWVPTGPRLAAPPTTSWPTPLAVSFDEAWMAYWDEGLWHVQNRTWTNVPVAGWKSPLRVFALARAADGSLAVATDSGAAVLREGRWAVLERGEVHDVTFDRDGTLWVAEQTSGSAATVAAFRLDGRAWKRTAYPSLTTPGWPRVVVGPDGEPWVGSGGWVGSLDHFDGAGWVPESPLGGPEPVNVGGLAVAPNGDLWVALSIQKGGEPSWAIARYDGATWTVRRAPDILADQGVTWLGDLAFAPDGTLWMATDPGLVRFDGRHGSLSFPGYGFGALSFAPDGSLWAVGPSGVGHVPAGQLVGR